MGHRLRGSLAQGGFTYLLLLVLIAALSAVAAVSLQQGSALSRREREVELLHLGRQFQSALQSYQVATPAGSRARPRTLEELVRDDRAPVPRRHLRRVLIDPITGHAEWGLLRDPTGEIVGVYSLAPGSPIKQSGFDPAFEHFREAKSYADWVFGAVVRR
jgi:type II secretory pathway pseudopilin PulG